MHRPLWTRSRLVTAAATAAVLVAAMTGVAPASAAATGHPIGIMGAGTNDFTGDGRADLTALYDYGGGEAGLFVLPGTPTIANNATTMDPVWWEGPGSYWPSVMKIAAGDYNGDGFSDVLALYDYGGGEVGLYIYPGTATRNDITAAIPYRISHVTSWGLVPSTAKVTAGDYTGDGLADLLVLNDYGGGSAGLLVFSGTTSRVQDSVFPHEVWRTPPRNFDVSRANVAAADFTADGKDDLLVLYDYGNREFALWVIPGTDAPVSGTVQPYWCWHTVGTHDSFSRAQLDTGDFNRDGRKDLVVRTDSVAWVVPHTTGAGDNATWPEIYYPGGFPLNRAKSIVGDYNGDGAADLIYLVDNGNGDAEVWVLAGGVPNSANRVPVEVWSTPGPGYFWPSVVKVA
ncbi:MAG TPA: VCBS repeat-containing protein [Actinophytocola sp.]|uniref:FG-GAP repeat domain-containing protein n=1 Tax=Actinophytocola sp. TaxID=1872138 RepID=UPI002DDCA9CA|nr:VCBS repeat-containing protein [Actinophytocola sp.]HEV2782838.1 VCBS repeat-containing protein [Actinophytocola sp.]